MTDKVTKEEALRALDDLLDCAMTDVGYIVEGAHSLLRLYINQDTERNAPMDKIVDHVHSSGKFEIDAAHARIVAAMAKRTELKVSDADFNEWYDSDESAGIHEHYDTAWSAWQEVVRRLLPKPTVQYPA